MKHEVHAEHEAYAEHEANAEREAHAEHEAYMEKALALARAAGRCGDVPVGCVIVRDGRVVGRGRNTREQRQNALHHAEIVAIDQACRALGTWRLDDCALYVTLEPCPMCAGAIMLARIGQVFYGASDTVLGACGGVMNLFEEAFGRRPRLRGGILRDECAQILSEFFDRLRAQEEERDEA